MTDIVERLRKENSFLPYYGVPKLQEDAAGLITTLRAEVERLTAEREEVFAKDRGRTAEHNILTQENRALRAEVERLESELSDALTDLGTARDDNASLSEPWKVVNPLRAENTRLRAAISWIEPPFVDDKTPEAELRERVRYCVADANRAALAQEKKEEAMKGYAPGNYMCKCADCGMQFEGDKRAFQCLACASNAADDDASAQKEEADGK